MVLATPGMTCSCSYTLDVMKLDAKCNLFHQISFLGFSERICLIQKMTFPAGQTKIVKFAFLLNFQNRLWKGIVVACGSTLCIIVLFI